jgi:CHAP domain
MTESLHPILAKNGITAGTPEAVLAVAEYFVKLKYEEGPSKDNLFGKWFGANHTAWCAEFVSYCFNKAGAGYVVNGLQTKNGYLSCGKGIAAMKKRGLKQVAVKDAQPGDIIFFDWEHDHDPDHTGIVLKNNPKKGTIVCREGNTSRGDGSKSNGGQVAERVRYYTNVFAVFRPQWKPVKPAVKAPVVPVEAPKVAVPVVAPVAPAKAPVKAPATRKPKSNITVAE